MQIITVVKTHVRAKL